MKRMEDLQPTHLLPELPLPDRLKPGCRLKYRNFVRRRADRHTKSDAGIYLSGNYDYLRKIPMPNWQCFEQTGREGRRSPTSAERTPVSAGRRYRFRADGI
jgi:hypothetical protein